MTHSFQPTKNKQLRQRPNGASTCRRALLEGEHEGADVLGEKEVGFNVGGLVGHVPDVPNDAPSDLRWVDLAWVEMEAN